MKRFVAFGASAALIVARRPQSFLQPQFHPDDAMMYADAYAHGFRSIAWPYAGYLNVLPRTLAWFSTFLPLHLAPLSLAVAAVAVFALVPAFLLSDRCANLGSLKIRIALAAVWVALPGTGSLQDNVANAQWHLAVLAFLILVAQDRRPWPDRAPLTILGVSSVFAVLLLPVAWLRRRYRLELTALAGIEAAVFLLSRTSAYRHSQLHPFASALASILANHVFINALFGPSSFCLAGGSALALAVVLAVGFAVAGYALARGPAELRLLWLFSLAVLAAVLGSGHPGGWPGLAGQGISERYWLIPSLAFVSSLFWLLSRGQMLKLVGGSLLALAILALPLTWRYPALPDTGFAQRAQAFEAAAPGTVIVFPLYSWPLTPMILTKRPVSKSWVRLPKE